MAPFKDEHILLLAPGSQTTQAQLGLPDSFTPARFRFPSRMFPAEKKGEWEPFKVREKVITVRRRVLKPPPPAASPEPEQEQEQKQEEGEEGGDGEEREEQKEGAEDGDGATKVEKREEEDEGTAANAGQDQEPADGDDVGMTDAPDASDVKQEDSQPAEPAPDKSTSTATAATTQEPASQPATSSPLSPPPDTSPPTPEYMEVEETQAVWQEDPTSEDGAVYPLRAGAIVDWPCFFALLTHIYNTLSPPFHTPVIMIAQPCWSLRDRELITQFVFEKFKVPAFCLVDAALAVCYAYGVTTATVVDVGYAKADVTAVVDSLVCEYGRGVALRGCGGDAATQRLHELLRSKGFSREMCEQLKRSNIAEVLATDIPMPGTDTAVRGRAAGASSGNGDGVPAPSVGEIIAGGQQTLPTQQGQSAADEDDDDGVLDVAAIVTGNTSEILAQKEREKAERLAAKKGGAGAAALDAAAKAARLPNAKKETNSFVFSEYVPVRDDNGVGEHYVLRTQEVEVGQERFRALTPADDLSGPDAPMFGVLEAIAAQVHHTIMSVPDVSRRAELWDSIVIVGGGSKLRGFSQALLAELTRRYLLTPATGTIFTADLPSQFPTPTGTGGTTTPANVNTPNPYLAAATSAAATSATPGPPAPANPNDPAQPRGPSASQTPLSIKLLKPPEYFPEFKAAAGTGAGTGANAGAGASGTSASGAGMAASSSAAATGSGTNKPGTTVPVMTSAGAAALGDAGSGPAPPNAGFAEAVFLGAQVAAKIVFMLDQGLSKGFLSRPEYNELGPTAIHDCGL